MEVTLDAQLSEKYDTLKQFIKEKGKNGVVIAFSGGLDSSTLASVTFELLGKKAIAVTAQSPTYPQSEVEAAILVAEEIGVEHRLITSDELKDKNFVRNPENRCYYCKTGLFKSIQKVCNELNMSTIFEGTNTSELGGHRPGFRAIEETINAYSPWVEADITKDEIRTLAKARGLSIHDKPAFACLSSRIPFGSTITAERLDRIAKAESFIRTTLNVRQLRVRDHDDIARIEVGSDERNLFFDTSILDKIHKYFMKIGYKFVTFDLVGYRTGSMLATSEIPTKNLIGT